MLLLIRIFLIPKWPSKRGLKWRNEDSTISFLMLHYWWGLLFGSALLLHNRHTLSLQAARCPTPPEKGFNSMSINRLLLRYSMFSDWKPLTVKIRASLLYQQRQNIKQVAFKWDCGMDLSDIQIRKKNNLSFQSYNSTKSNLLNAILFKKKSCNSGKELSFSFSYLCAMLSREKDKDEKMGGGCLAPFPMI